MTGLSLRKRKDKTWGIWDTRANGWINDRHYGDKKHAKFDKQMIAKRRKQK